MKDLSNRTAVIVLNWNKPKMTLECLESLQTMEGKYDIFIVDNGSDEDKRQELIKEMKKRQAVILTEEDLDKFQLDDRNGQLLLLILLNENYGYAKGNNYGLRLAHKLGYKYSLISNNDIKIIDRNVLVELIRGIESDEKYAWAGPRVIGPDGKQQGPFCRKNFFIFAFEEGFFYPFFRLVRLIRTKKKLSDTKIKCKKNPDMIQGCFFIVKNKYGNQLDFFDENTLLYAEEDILSAKFKERGLGLKYVSSVKIMHFGGSTTGSYIAEKKMLLIATKSFLYYFKKYRGYSKFLCEMALISRLSYIFFYRPIVRFIKRFYKMITARDV